MIAVAHRINVILNDEIWEQLQDIPQGERSRLINQSLAEILRRRQREEAFARIRERAAAMEPLGMSVEEWVRQDRDSHE